MRKKIKQAYLPGVLISLLLVIGLVSCNNGEDGWATDPAFAGLFRPLAFTSYSIGANSVGISFTKVVDAQKYIIELSEDSLQFNKISKRITISADTLIPFAASASVPNIEYRILVDDLNANQRHSARLIAVNKDSSLTSKYITFTFKTAMENILAPVKIENTTAVFKWNKTSKLDYLVIYKSSDPTAKNILQSDSVLSNQEKTDSTKTVANLEFGTVYIAKVCYQDGTTTRLRGTKIFKISGIAGSYVINLKSGDDINTVLSQNAGQSSVTLMLDPGVTYNIGTVNVPSGMSYLMLSCLSNSNLPVVNMAKVKPASDMSGVMFENLKMVGPGSSSTSNVLMDLNTNLKIGNFTLQGCSVSAYNGIVKISSTATVSLDMMYMDNCIVSDMGSSNVLNVAGTSPANQVNNAVFQNSTFINLNTQFADIRCQMASFTVNYCTFYNNSSTNKLSHLFRFTDGNTTPASFTVTNCIFAGNNGGTTLKSFYASYTPLAAYSFSLSYKTSDMVVSTTAGQLFTGINALGLSSTDLFTDPVNGNFTVKVTSVDFAGKGKAGDPRWW